MNNIYKDKDQPAENILYKSALRSELWAGYIPNLTMKQIIHYERTKESQIWTESLKKTFRIYTHRLR